MTFFSLKAKMTIAVSLLIVCIISGLVFYTTNYFQERFQDLLVRQQALLLDEISGDFASTVNFAHQALVETSHNGALKDVVNDPDEVQRFLDNRFVRKIFDNGMFVFSPQGRLVAESPFIQGRRGTDFSFRQYFIETKRRARPCISDPYISSKTQGPAVMFTAPVFGDTGELLAILGGSLSLMNNSLFGKISESKIGNSGFSYIFNNNGILIVHPDKSRILKSSVPDETVFKTALNGFEGTITAKGFYGTESLVTFKRLGTTNWILAAEYPLAEAYAPLTAARKYFLAGIVASCSFALIIVWLFMKYLTLPLVSITEQVKNLSLDRFNPEIIKVKTKDEIGHLAAAFNTMTERLATQADELRQGEAILKRYQLLSEHARDIIIIVNLDGRIIEANKAAAKAYGYSREELLAMNMMELKTPGTGKLLSEYMPKLYDEGVLYEANHMRQDGTFFPVEISSQGATIGEEIVILKIIRDITERKQAEELINHLAYHDPLTDLPNRALFHDRLSTAIAQAKRHKQVLAVMFLDLDRFKFINDTMGHSVGDELLQGVAYRLIKCVRVSDTVARMGGDEFTLLLPQIRYEEDATQIARKIIDTLKQPWYLSGHEFHITTSIGIALYPSDGNDAETLMKHADVAMYRAKEQGDKYQFFDKSMNEKAYERLTMERELRKALKKQELRVFYQPQVDSRTGRIHGVEALVRWEHPSRGLLPACEFVPTAESTGLISPIGEWVLRTACRQHRAWSQAGIDIRLTVNLSAAQFRQERLLEMIAGTVRETGIDPNKLELEITESIAMQDVEFTVELLQEMRKMGISVSIDDFGTGYSSLNYLKRLPIDTLKIDKSFVRDVISNPEDAAIVKTIIVLANNLNLKVIIEGVETAEQMAFFEKQAAHYMQGYYFSRPVPAEEIVLKYRPENYLGKEAN